MKKFLDVFVPLMLIALGFLFILKMSWPYQPFKIRYDLDRLEKRVQALEAK